MMKKRYTVLLSLFFVTAMLVQGSIAQSNDSEILSLRNSLQYDTSQSISLEEILNNIEEDRNIVFLYDVELIEGKTVSLSSIREPERDLGLQLASILRPFDLSYERKGGRSYIIVSKDKKQQALEGILQGTVIDGPTGEPMPGVNVFIPELNIGAASDAEGTFEISDVPEGTYMLRATFVGYETYEEEIEISEGDNTIEIVMNPSAMQLDEVVVSGLASSVKRENLANSVTKINADELTGNTTPATVDGALQGKVVGTNMTSSGGAPGGGVDIKLRGISTLGAGSSQPLIIVDGIYINNDELETGVSAVSAQQAASQDDGANRLADLNPDEIESIEILKGPSAAAIYGARANAGVVIIETKRGSGGATRVSFSQDVGYSSILNKIGAASWSEDKIDLVYGAGSSAAQSAKQMYNDAVANGTLRDYEELIFGREGAQVNTQISVSGGDAQTQFYVSGAFKDENGIIENTGFDRYSLRANIDHQLNENIDISSSTNYINTETNRGWTGNGGVGSVVQAVAFTPPFAQLLPDENGDYPDNPFFQMNPLELIEYGVNRQEVNRFLQSLSANFKLYSSGAHTLNFNLDGGVDFMNSNTMAYMPPFLQYQQSQANPGDVIHSAEKVLNINLQAFLVYNTMVGSEDSPWNLTTQAGYTTYHNERQLQQVRGRGLVPGQTNVENASLQEIYNQYFVDVTDVGYVAQQEVNWDDKVIGTVGARFDKSTLNADQDKYYFFPKASMAVNITNFEFWSADILEQFKLRAAYGETGGLPNFGVTFEALNSGLISGNLGTFRSTRTIDPNLEPETAQELEVGVDLGLRGGRASLEATYYRKNVSDLILDQELPSSSGLQVMATNAADLQNEGIELALRTVPVQANKFSWNSTVNWWKNTAEITNLKVPSFTTGGFGAALGTFYIAEGFSPTTIVGTPFDTEAGRFTVYGDSQPDYQMSWTNTINFLNNWEFNFFWHYSHGQKVINLRRFLADNAGTTPDWNNDSNGDGTPDGLDRPGEGAGRFVADAGYLKLRELSLYYSVPASFLESYTGGTVKSVRLGASGNNVLLFSDYPSYDPEVSEFGSSAIGTGVEVAAYPSARKIMFHLKLDF
ncbi:SusC/RagA family protein [Aliifodinibius salipaludis]|uniref:SusC/RagA family protein n=1 Tax=Fodinibius salipaludis TaxID=2032627 RepID=A0A2A2GA73_9BACT|nr:SusC/RagA family TonB-linked outer membrane protein [Aliifodinibius salipaludis]PAU94481.1 SusC/RagA family protein [Aliifodinibius salipaludis]